MKERMSDAQRRLLNAICADLAAQVVWHGQRMDKDSWRHLASGTILGWRMVHGIDRGQGAPGFVLLGGSSLSLSKEQAAEAITMLLDIGDQPENQGLQGPRVKWSSKVLMGLGFSAEDIAA